MGAAGILLCPACGCGKLCGCASAHVPVAEACDHRITLTKVSWEAVSTAPHVLSVKRKQTNEANDYFRERWDVGYNNGAGTISARALAGCLNKLVGVRVVDYRGDTPVVFDTLTTSGLPWIDATNSSLEERVGYGDTAPVARTPQLGEHRRTEMAWGRAGTLSVGFLTRLLLDPKSDGVALSIPNDIHFDIAALHEPIYVPLDGDGNPAPFPQFGMRKLSFTAIAAGGATPCEIPRELTQSTADWAQHESTIVDEQYLNPTYNIVTTLEQNYRAEPDPFDAGQRLSRLVELAATVDVEDEPLPDNVGCLKGPRAIRVRVTYPSGEIDAVDEIYVQDCLTPEYAPTAPVDTFPYVCVWRSVTYPTLTLTKQGPLHWELRHPASALPLMLRGTGESPTSIVQGMFRLTGPLIAERPIESPDVVITAAAVPEGYACACDPCDCDAAPGTATVQPCEDLPAVAMEASEEEYCSFAGEEAAPVEDCDAVRVQIDAHAPLVLRIVAMSNPTYVDEDGNVQPAHWFQPGDGIEFVRYPAGTNQLVRANNVTPGDDMYLNCGAFGPSAMQFSLQEGFSFTFGRNFTFAEIQSGDEFTLTHSGETITIRFETSEPLGLFYRATVKIVDGQFELRYGPSDESWTIVAHKPCAGGPLGTYTVSTEQSVGEPPCEVTEVEVG